MYPVEMRSGVHAIPTIPTFQMNTRPSTAPEMIVAMLWTIAPRVIPARPFTFWGLSLSCAVNAPV